MMLAMYHNRPKVERLIADFVIQSDGADKLAELVCELATNIITQDEFLLMLNGILRQVEATSE